MVGGCSTVKLGSTLLSISHLNPSFLFFGGGEGEGGRQSTGEDLVCSLEEMGSIVTSFIEEGCENTVSSLLPHCPCRQRKEHPSCTVRWDLDPTPG